MSDVQIEKMVFWFAWIVCSITKCRFFYSTHSGCVFIFFGFWTYVNLRFCDVSGTTPSATLSREHISRGSFEFARTLACLETPTNLRNVSFALESKFPDNSNHQTYPWKLDVWRARFRRSWASNVPCKPWTAINLCMKLARFLHSWGTFNY